MSWVTGPTLANPSRNRPSPGVRPSTMERPRRRRSAAAWSRPWRSAAGGGGGARRRAPRCVADPAAPPAQRRGRAGARSTTATAALVVRRPRPATRSAPRAGTAGSADDYAMEDTASGRPRRDRRPRRRAPTSRSATGRPAPTPRRPGSTSPTWPRPTGGSSCAWSGDSVLLTDVTGTSRGQLADWRCPDSASSTRMMLVGDQVVVTATGVRAIAARWTRGGLRRTGPRWRRAGCYVLDVSDPARPTLVTDRTCSGSGALDRQYGDTVRLVTQTPAPAAALRVPRRRHRRARGDAPGTERWCGRAPSRTGCPRGSRTGSASDCRLRRGLPPASTWSGAGTIAVVGFDVGTPDDRVDGGRDRGRRRSTPRPSGSTSRPPSTRTSLIAGWGPGSIGGPALPDRPHRHPRVRPRRRRHPLRRGGSVDGVLKDRWSLDEHDGHLRLASDRSPCATDDGADRRGTTAIVRARRARRPAGRGPGALDGLGTRRADPVGALVRRPGGRGHLPPDGPALHRSTSSDPDHPRLLRRAEDPRLLRLPAPDRRRPAARRRQRRDQPGPERSGPRPRSSTSPTLAQARAGRQGDLRPQNSWLEAAEDPHAFTWLPGRRRCGRALTAGAGLRRPHRSCCPGRARRLGHLRHEPALRLGSAVGRQPGAPPRRTAGWRWSGPGRSRPSVG